jgi:hypothetical protein
MPPTTRTTRTTSPLSRLLRSAGEAVRESAHVVEIAALKRSVSVLRAERDEARRDERAVTARFTALERELAAMRRSGRGPADAASGRRSAHAVASAA